MIVKIKMWRLPDCQEMSIQSLGWDSWLDRIGILKRLRKFSFKSSKVNRVSNYKLLMYQRKLIRCIGRIVHEDKSEGYIQAYIPNFYEDKRSTIRYWKEAYWVMRQPEYIALHIYKINKNFGREFSRGSLLHLVQNVVSRLTKDTLRIDLRRKWIQAPAPKCRSLTIPLLPDRVVSGMYNTVIELYLKGSFGLDNYAYQEGKGATHALQDLFSLGYLAKGNIYEYDLSNFFPSVEHSKLSEVMKELSFPNWVIGSLLLPLRKKPLLSLDLEVKDYQQGGPSIFFPNYYSLFNDRGESNYKFGKERDVGVPMGLAYSPLLAILVLTLGLRRWRALHPNRSHITYADDGLLMWSSDDRLALEDFSRELSSLGIITNASKSSMIKKSGCWLKEFKYLGVVYDPVSDNIMSKTRSGTSMLLRKVSSSVSDSLRYLGMGLMRKFRSLVSSYISSGSHIRDSNWEADIIWGELNSLRLESSINWATHLSSMLGSILNFLIVHNGSVVRYPQFWSVLHSILVRRRLELHDYSYKEFVRTKYWGLALSRIYSGSWWGEVITVRDLSFQENSYINYLMIRGEAPRATNIINASSYSCSSLVDLICESLSRSRVRCSYLSHRLKVSKAIKYERNKLRLEKLEPWSSSSSLIVDGKRIYARQLGSRNYQLFKDHLSKINKKYHEVPGIN